MWKGRSGASVHISRVLSSRLHLANCISFVSRALNGVVYSKNDELSSISKAAISFALMLEDPCPHSELALVMPGISRSRACEGLFCVNKTWQKCPG